MRGNVIELAVGVVIGAAFTAVVTAFSDSIINPLLASLGGVDYSAYSKKDKGEALEISLPLSGTTVSPRPVMIMKTSDNKEAAQAFVDFMFSEEAQQISASKYMIPANPEVEPKESPKLDEITQLIPKSISAHGACSLEDPQPKLSPATSTPTPLYSGRLRMKSGFTFPSSSKRKS